MNGLAVVSEGFLGKPFRVCPQSTSQTAFVGKLRKTKRGRPRYSADPNPAKAGKKWALDFVGGLNVWLSNRRRRLRQRNKIKLFFTLQTLSENGVEDENQPNHPA